MWNGINRRKFPRANYKCLITIKKRLTAKTISTHTENIGAGGICVLIKEDLARGDQGMRLIRDDLEATGTQWTYDHAHKKVSLHGRVRIVFKAEVKNLIK